MQCVRQYNTHTNTHILIDPELQINGTASLLDYNKMGTHYNLKDPDVLYKGRHFICIILPNGRIHIIDEI